MTFVIKQSPRKPPLTKARKFQWLKQRDGLIDIDIQVEVLPDGIIADESKRGRAQTAFTIAGSIGERNSFWRSARYVVTRSNGVELVTSIVRRIEVKGIIRIQTSYGPGASAEQPSGYGRGTTPQDEFSGNSSLGFHESCHQADYLAYLTSMPFPKFTGKVGMTKQQFEEAFHRWGEARKWFFKRMSEVSVHQTDEAGYKQSTYRSKGQRPQPLAPNR